jgi:transposase
MLDTADRRDGKAGELRTAWLTTRLGDLRRQMRQLKAMEQAVGA